MYKLFVADLKMIIRNRQALFWAFMFPVMFTLIFGLFFGKNSSVGTISVINHSNSEISKSLTDTIKGTSVFTIVNSDNIDQAKDQIKKSTISVAIEIPESFGSFNQGADNTVKLIYDQGNAQTASVVNGFVDKFLTQASYKIQNVQPIFSIVDEKVSDKNLTYFDFVLSGILGIALMNSSVIGIAVGMSKYREDKILKRITTTPVKPSTFVLAEVFSRLVLNLAQILVVLAIGIYGFDAHIYGNIFVILGISLIGAILFQLIGFVIASLSKTTSAAEGMATAITIPMMFLAGVFFPTDNLPKWLSGAVAYLPLAPLLRMIRQAALDAVSPFSDPKNIIIVGTWIIVCLAISIYKFRLSEE